MSIILPDSLVQEFNDFVKEQIGMYSSATPRTVSVACMEALLSSYDSADIEKGIRQLMKRRLSSQEIGILAHHFSIGETYFFREPTVFHALEFEILPQLIASGYCTQRKLRIWSAGCCTGEELYTVAIILHRLLPEPSTWNIALFGTDIHPGFLAQAERGIYRAWSFRNASHGIRGKYFDSIKPGYYAIRSFLRKQVQFKYLNLADAHDDDFPEKESVNIVLCRNVLMYFPFSRASQVMQRLRQAIHKGGWLIVSAVEAGQDFFQGFEKINFSGAKLFRKKETQEVLHGSSQAGLSSDSHGTTIHIPSAPYVQTMEAKDRSITDLCQDRLAIASMGESPGKSHDRVMRARHYADRGNYKEAEHACIAAIASDQCNAELRYLRAMIQEEQGQLKLAMALLRQAIYLDQDFVLAHFSLGNLCRRRGLWRDAQKYFSNAAALLCRYEQDEVVPYSEGLTAGRLVQILRAIGKKYESA